MPMQPWAQRSPRAPALSPSYRRVRGVIAVAGCGSVWQYLVGRVPGRGGARGRAVVTAVAAGIRPGYEGRAGDLGRRADGRARGRASAPVNWRTLSNRVRSTIATSSSLTDLPGIGGSAGRPRLVQASSATTHGGHREYRRPNGAPGVGGCTRRWLAPTSDSGQLSGASGVDRSR